MLPEILPIAAALLLAVPVLAQQPKKVCPAGQEANADTENHCCWPGQGWAGKCVGEPTKCPDGWERTTDACTLAACTSGQVRMRDGLHCCWPGQAWVSSRNACVGEPACPAGAERSGTSCSVPAPRGCPSNMVGLPGGTYTMGDKGTMVTVAPFCLDTWEVWADAYAKCVAAGRCTSVGLGCSDSATYGKPGKGNHPVNCVDWNQATDYCAWAGKRLPTEEEWEWAARGAGRGTTYPWGNEPPSNQLCWDGPNNNRRAKGFEATCEVGSYPAGDSPQGVKNLAGGVWEWTSTSYDASSRVYRGGGWFNANPQYVSAANRGWAPPDYRSSSVGFRCARTP